MDISVENLGQTIFKRKKDHEIMKIKFQEANEPFDNEICLFMNFTV